MAEQRGKRGREGEKMRTEEKREQEVQGTVSGFPSPPLPLLSSSPSSLPCVVLAGGKAKPDIIALTGQSNRSQVVVRGKTLLRHVIDALHTAGADGGTLGPIAVVGDVGGDAAYTVVGDSGDFVGNVFAGLACFPDAPYVLITTSDLPFLTGAVVGEFARGAMALAQSEQADIIYPVVPVALCYERFPGVKRTALRLREGRFTGGNLVLARPGFLLAHHARIKDAYAARKTPLRLAAMLGVGMIGRLALSQKVHPGLLTIPLLEARAGRLLGGRARAYLSQSPELATDLDRPSDFEAVGLSPQEPAVP